MPVPFNLAVFDIDAAQAVITEHPEIDRWAVGGHSLGGSMAAQFLASHQGAIEGLVLWASFRPQTSRRPASPWASTYGTLDAGVASYTSPANVAKLARDVTFTPIEGGNREQMGWYTGQPNDPPAAISREAQQQAVVAATLDLLQALSMNSSAVGAMYCLDSSAGFHRDEGKLGRVVASKGSASPEVHPMRIATKRASVRTADRGARCHPVHPMLRPMAERPAGTLPPGSRRRRELLVRRNVHPVHPDGGQAAQESTRPRS